jgi:hypothetical protein
VQRRAIHYAPTLQDLIDDPTVVVQRLPDYVSGPQEFIGPEPADYTSSLLPATMREAPTGDATHLTPMESGSTFYTQNTPSPESGEYKLRISNGSGRADLAREFAGLISERGFVPDFVANARSFDYKTSYVFYNPGLLGAAEKIAEQMPVPVKLVEASRGSGSVEIVLGADLVNFDD